MVLIIYKLVGLREYSFYSPLKILLVYFFIQLSNRICEPQEKKTSIEEKWETYGSFSLTSVQQETHEKYFYGTEHWNYFTNDEDLGPVLLSLKQENINGRDQFR